MKGRGNLKGRISGGMAAWHAKRSTVCGCFWDKLRVEKSRHGCGCSANGTIMLLHSAKELLTDVNNGGENSK